MVGDKFEIVSLADIDCHEDIPETADTLEGNALLKARFVHERYGLDVFADDTGLEVDALGGNRGCTLHAMPTPIATTMRRTSTNCCVSCKMPRTARRISAPSLR